MKLNTLLMTTTLAILLTGTAFGMTGSAMPTDANETDVTAVEDGVYEVVRNRERGRNGCDCDGVPDRDRDRLQIGTYRVSSDETQTKDQLKDGSCEDDEPDRDRIRDGRQS